MSKLQKFLYLIDLMERRGPMSLMEINKLPFSLFWVECGALTIAKAHATAGTALV